MRRCSRIATLALAMALALALALTVPGLARAVPRVAVTVKPLHSLVAGVMAGIGEPDLVIRGAGSPHTYSLKPSDARLLQGAEIVFWIGESLETFMAKPLAALASRALIVEVERAPGIALLGGREGGAWENHPGTDHPDARGGDAAHGGATHDGHLWLDPANARVIVRLAAEVLGGADPVNRARYAANAAALVARIDRLDAELRGRLAHVADIPYVVFHDAYHYFEKTYALGAVGSIAVSPERGPGARRVKEMREKIVTLGARCVLSEPQFPAALVGTLVEGTAARVGVLDPLGAALPAGPEAYFELMRLLGTTLVDCLSPR